jgi:hypothetical protein
VQADGVRAAVGGLPRPMGGGRVRFGRGRSTELAQLIVREDELRDPHLGQVGVRVTSPRPVGAAPAYGNCVASSSRTAG